MTRAADAIAWTPRGLSRDQAARYIGVGVTKFDEMVADGRMPRSKAIDGRRVWDRFALDLAFEAIGADAPNAIDAALARRGRAA